MDEQKYHKHSRFNNQKQLKASKAQKDTLHNCYVGVGFLVYKSANNQLTQTEFCLVKGIPCYLTTGKPIQFSVQEDMEGFKS